MTIPNQTFVMRAEETAYLAQAIGRKLGNSKQCIIRHDAVRKRNIIMHGDFQNWGGVGDSHAGGVWAYDPVAEIVDGDANLGLTNVSPCCHGPGATTDFQGNDGAALGVDYQNDVLWTTPGSDFGVTHGGTCSLNGNAAFPSIAGSTFYSGLMKMNLSTGAWTGESTESTARENNMMGGHFDPVQRCLYGIANGTEITRIFVDVRSKLQTTINYVALGMPNLPSGSAGGTEVEAAFDFVGRWGYYFAASYEPALGGDPQYYFFRFNLDSPSVQVRLANPPFMPPTYPHRYAACHIRGLHFDTRNRKVVWFYRRTGGGRKIHGIAVYSPVTNLWETIPITQSTAAYGPVCGGSIGYDSTNNVFFGFGTAGYTPGEDVLDQETDIVAPQTTSHHWLWRYA